MGSRDSETRRAYPARPYSSVLWQTTSLSLTRLRSLSSLPSESWLHPRGSLPTRLMARRELAHTSWLLLRRKLSQTQVTKNNQHFKTSFSPAQEIPPVTKISCKSDL